MLSSCMFVKLFQRANISLFHKTCRMQYKIANHIKLMVKYMKQEMQLGKDAKQHSTVAYVNHKSTKVFSTSCVVMVVMLQQEA